MAAFPPFHRPKPQRPAIRQGGVYVLRDCPPLRGGAQKDRPVIVVSTPSKTGTPGEIIRVVACSTSADEETDPDIIKVPTADDTPNCRTGLWKSCYAVPEWYLLVRIARAASIRRIVISEVTVPADVKTLLREIAELSPDELQDLRRQMDSMLRETPEQALSRKLRERGLVRTPRLPRDPAESIDPTPAVVTGEPISQTLIRERR